MGATGKSSAVSVGTLVGGTTGSFVGTFVGESTGCSVGTFVGESTDCSIGSGVGADVGGVAATEESQHPKKSPSAVGQHNPKRPEHSVWAEQDAGSKAVGEAVNSIGIVQSTSSNEYSTPLCEHVNVNPTKCSFNVKFAYRKPQFPSIVLFGLS